MSQWLRQGKLPASREPASPEGIDVPPTENGGGDNVAALRFAPRIAVASGEAPTLPRAPGAAGRPDQDPRLLYIVSMTHELKQMALKSGYSRLAMLLEMAELDALDQVNSP